MTLLLKMLSEQHRVLKTARADAAVLADFQALISYLKRAPRGFVEGMFTNGPVPTVDSRKYTHFKDDEFTLMSLDQLESLVKDETTPRKDLERIAIRRFHIPQGSMRSFSSRMMLQEKLLASIRGERTHTTIDNIARRER